MMSRDGVTVSLRAKGINPWIVLEKNIRGERYFIDGTKDFEPEFGGQGRNRRHALNLNMVQPWEISSTPGRSHLDRSA